MIPGVRCGLLPADEDDAPEGDAEEEIKSRVGRILRGSRGPAGRETGGVEVKPEEVGMDVR